MATVNIKRLFLALVTKDEVGAANVTFSTPEYIPGVQSFDAKTKSNTAENYEEGKLTDQDTVLQSVGITINLGHLSNAQYAKYFGKHIATEGGVYSLGDDVAPYVAVLYEYERSDHKLGYKVYYKGLFEELDDSVKQREGKTTYQNIVANASFQPLRNNGMTKYTVEEGDPDCPEDITTKFFATVIIPTPKAA